MYGVPTLPPSLRSGEHGVQRRNATPFGEGPQFIVRDRDDKYAAQFDRVAKEASIRVIKTAARTPLMNATMARFVPSARRERLDHVIILGEAHLCSVLNEFVTRYLNTARPQQGLAQRIAVPTSRKARNDASEVVAMPVLGGIHHDYCAAA